MRNMRVPLFYNVSYFFSLSFRFEINSASFVSAYMVMCVNKKKRSLIDAKFQRRIRNLNLSHTSTTQLDSDLSRYITVLQSAVCYVHCDRRLSQLLTFLPVFVINYKAENREQKNATIHTVINMFMVAGRRMPVYKFRLKTIKTIKSNKLTRASFCRSVPLSFVAWYVISPAGFKLQIAKTLRSAMYRTTRFDNIFLFFCAKATLLIWTECAITYLPI